MVNRSKDTYEIQTEFLSRDAFTGEMGKHFLMEGESFIWLRMPEQAGYTAFVKIDGEFDPE